MYSLPTTHRHFITPTSNDGHHCGLGKYTSTSISSSFASVVSSSCSPSAIPVSPTSFQSHSASTSTMSSSSPSLAQQQHPQQVLYQHHQQRQKHEHGQTSPPSAVLLPNSNNFQNNASLSASFSVTSSSQSSRSPARSFSSTYDSALPSPASHSFSANQSSNGSTGPDQSGFDSSEFEVYLNTLVLHESVSHMHGTYLSYAVLALFSYLLSVSADLVSREATS